MIRAKSRRLVMVAVAVAGVMLLSGCDLYSFARALTSVLVRSDGHGDQRWAHGSVLRFLHEPKGRCRRPIAFQVSDEIKSLRFCGAVSDCRGRAGRGLGRADRVRAGTGCPLRRPQPQDGSVRSRRPNYSCTTVRHRQQPRRDDVPRRHRLFDTPPAGFPGNNDHWHNHGPLCVTAPGRHRGDRRGLTRLVHGSQGGRRE